MVKQSFDRVCQRLFVIADNEFERNRYLAVCGNFVSMDTDRSAQYSGWAQEFLSLIEKEKQAKRDLEAICEDQSVAKTRVITEATALQTVYYCGFQHGESLPEGYGAAINDLFDAQKLLEATSCQVELQQQLYENVMQRVNLLAQEIFGEVELECLGEDIQGAFAELQKDMCALCQLIIDFRPQLDSSEKASPYSRSLTQFVAFLKYMQVVARDLNTPLDPFLAGLCEGEKDLTMEAFIEGIRLILTPPCGENPELTMAFANNALKQAKLKRLIANLSLLRQE